jgi:competence protein ComEC
VSSLRGAGPAALVAAATWIAAAAVARYPGAAGIVTMAVLSAAAAAAVAPLLLQTSRSRRMALAVVMALAMAAVAAAQVAVSAPARAEVAALSAEGGRFVELEATVSGKVDPTATGFRSDAVSRWVRTGDQQREAAAPVMLLWSATPPSAVDAGAVLRVSGSAVAADPGDRAVLIVRVAAVELIRPPGGVLAGTSELRGRLRATADTMPAPGAELVSGLAVGDTLPLSADLEGAMQRTALTHLTAVSGANCAIVVGVGFGICTALRVRRGIRVVVGLALLAGFVLLVTPEPSVVRAAAMAGIAMLALLLGRPAAGTATLCAAVAVCLAADPWLARSIGFALSVAATGALLVLARPLARGLRRWMPPSWAVTISVPIAAQLATAPLVATLSPGIPAYGMLANLLATPAAPLVTVLGLAACITAPIPALHTALTAAAWLPASWIAGVALTVDGLPGAILPWPEGPAGPIGLIVAGAAVVILLVPPGRSRAAHWARRIAGAAAAGIAGTVAGSLLLTSIAAPLTIPARWSLAVCDVGQGDAIVARSRGSTMLVDTGADSSALGRCLTRLGIDRLDILVLTHFDTDHAGAAPALTGRADLVLHGPPPPPAAGLPETLHAGRVALASAGMTGELGDARWRVLWPPAEATGYGPGNDLSVVMEISGPDAPRTLLLGDLGAGAQAALAGSGMLAPPYPVVKVAHHGSADQDPQLYRLLQPRLGLISVGEGNPYGHPRDAALDLLASLGTVVARTDREGLILVGTDPDPTWWRERTPARGTSQPAATLETCPAAHPRSAGSSRSRGARRAPPRSC